MKNIIKTLSLGLLLSASFMQGMEEEQPLGLMDMQDEILLPIFSQLGADENPIEYIKSFAKLRKTCSRFNSLLNDDENDKKDNEVAKLVRQKFSQQELDEHFFKAVENGNAETVNIFLKKMGADVNTVSGIYGRTALMEAALDSHTNIVQLLIDAGANVYARDDNNSTALHYARNSDITQLLTDAIHAPPSDYSEFWNSDGSISKFTSAILLNVAAIAWLIGITLYR